MDLLFANNTESTLAAALTAGAASMTVQAADAAKFPAPTGGRVAKCTLEGRNTGQIEIVHITARAGPVCTIARAQEGTTAKAFRSGDIVSMRWTKECSELATPQVWNFTGAFLGATGGTKAVTGVTIAGSIATIAAAANGYANGDLVVHDNTWPANLQGAFIISNVAAGTYDITFRTDRSNTPPVTGALAVNTQKAGAFSSASGWYSVANGVCEFSSRMVASSLTNITGSILVVLPVPPVLVGAGTGITALEIGMYSGITHTGALDALVRQNGATYAEIYKNVGSGLAPAALVSGDLAAPTEILLSGRYLC